MNVKHTANYISADSNFEISNISSTHVIGKEHQLVCVLMNILQRGCPTFESEFLSRYIGRRPEWPIRLFSDVVPLWGNIIKGNDETNDYPARTFYYELLPTYFSEFPYIQQVLIPEVKIGDIVPSEDNDFANQQVDFYMPDARLVIEIDGVQHNEQLQQILDRKRDAYLNRFGVKTVRISADSVKNNDVLLEGAMESICNRIKEFKTIMVVDCASYRLFSEGQLEDIYWSIAAIRLQIAVLELFECGWIGFKDKEIRIAIKNHEVQGYEKVAIEDLLLWIENLAVLMDIDFVKPEINICQVEKIEDALDGFIPIEMSVTKSIYQIENRSNSCVYITNCCRQDTDYFYVRTDSPIKYEIGDDVAKREALLFMLRNIFRHESFRNGQERIIINSMKRNDTVGVLPTGSGKSLCYQLAALLQPAISFCVSPIKSLMVDQFNNLLKLRIARIAYVSSDLDGIQRKTIESDYAKHKFLWIFVSPERFQDKMFREYLLGLANNPKTTFGYGIIDEVHCLSEWGIHSGYHI